MESFSQKNLLAGTEKWWPFQVEAVQMAIMINDKQYAYLIQYYTMLRFCLKICYLLTAQFPRSLSPSLPEKRGIFSWLANTHILYKC